MNPQLTPRHRDWATRSLLVAFMLVSACGGTEPASQAPSIAPPANTLTVAPPTSTPPATTPPVAYTQPTAPSTPSVSAMTPDAPPVSFPGYATNDLMTVLAGVEQAGRTGLDDTGRILMLPPLPGDLDLMSALAVAGTNSYDIHRFADPNTPDIPSLDKYPNRVHVVLRVFPTTDADRKYTEDRGTTIEAMGGSQVVIGSDVTASCPSHPEGYNYTVLYWIEGDLSIAIEVYPLPECEDSPLTLDDVITIASELLACKDLASETPDCIKLYP
jgi:hypothetical protein